MLTLLKRSAAIVVVLSTFLSTTQLASAETFSFPQQYKHAGLTFFQPLSFSETKNLSLHPAVIQFSKPQILSIKDTVKTQSLETVVLAPTLEPLPTVSAPITAEVTSDLVITPQPTKLLPTPTPKIAIPTPTPIKSGPTTPPAAATSAVQTQTAGGLSGEKLFSMSNAYRQAQGLPPFEKDERACTLAASRAPEINGEIAAGAMHSGLRARALPYWNTENIISMNSEEAAFNWWVNDPIHHDAIVGNYKYSCAACAGNACAQEFTNFQAK